MPKSPFAVLVGSESLLGREIRDIAATGQPGFELRLIAADGEEAGRLTRVGDEPVTVGDLDAANLSGAGVLFLAGSAAASRKALDLTGDEGTPVIDLTPESEEQPGARVRAPLVESPGEECGEDSRLHVIAHPAAMALALLLRRLHANDPLRRAVVQIFAPASEQGKAGVEELQQQTISLLSFKPLPHAVFDTQLSFNMLAGYGEAAPAPLEDTELRIERHLATLLDLPGEGRGAPLPSLRVIQAPVFHGYTFGIWAEFENSPDLEAVAAGLAAANIEVRSGEFEPPTNVGQAGQSGIAVGAIAPDRNHADALWLWMAADNYRLAAEGAVAVARQLL
ncbi:MAG TPA: Asd/ArgC dimerization domain-containing protein [Bryobacteraceae bacterium]|nr:Asd/ArgC dimerization domain-containing protein [Bryobacteraceae bacterium]